MRAEGGDESHVADTDFGGRYSPDGKRIASVRSGSLAVYPAAGGRPVIVVKGDVGQHCWSPDSEWIWFDQNRSVMKVPSQGGAAIQQAVKEGALVDCSPDGSIAYATQGGEIRLLEPDGKTSRPLLPGFTARGVFSATADGFSMGSGRTGAISRPSIRNPAPS